MAGARRRFSGFSFPRPIGTYVVALTFAAVACVVLAAATGASATVQTTLYVSPTGSGSSCTSTTPCSLTSAQTAVRGINSSMSGDIVVQLAGGTYRLSSTWNFTGSDSATNGHSIIWQATPAQTPVITGGSQPTSWTLINSSTNLWQGNIPSGVTSYDLWVNGIRATLSQGNASTLFPSGTTQNSTGYVVSGNTLQGLSNPAGMILVGQGQGWVQNTCSVSSVTGNSSQTTVTMDEPCYQEGYDSYYAPTGLPIRVENEQEWINGPNQWAFNRSTGKVYFEAPSGVSMSSADAELGNLTTLVSLNGTESSPVTGISFSGITFQNTTLPDTVTDGFAAIQADIQWPDLTCAQDWNNSSEVTPSGGASEDGTPFGSCAVPMLSAVAVHAGRAVSFVDDTFAKLGTAGVSFDGGTQNSSIVGSTLTDIGGNAVQIGSVLSPNQSDSALVDSGDTVKDNLVDSPAFDYHGGVGIWAGYTAALTIENNTIQNAPYSGISTGWGWGSLDTLPSIDNANHVVNNYVTNVQQDSLQYDGGGIYNLGPQPNGVISGNHTSGTTRFGIYLDMGTTGWSVNDNVVTGDQISWVFSNSYNGYDHCETISFTNNYTDNIGTDTTGGVGLNTGCLDGSGHSRQSNTGLKTNLSNTTALGIEDRAGQQFPYKTYASTAATYQQSNGTFTIDAAGSDVWGSTDQYGSLYTPAGAGSSNTTIVEVNSLSNTNSWAKAGIMLRNSIPGSGASLGYAVLAVTPGNGVALQWDNSSSGGLNQYQATGSSITAPVWLKLVRSGSTITGYYSTNGTTYTQVATATLTGANTSEDVGLFASSHSSGVSGQAVFSNYSSSNSPFATFANTAATLVNDSNGDFTIDSAGADVWGSTDQYGSIYVPGGAGTSNTTTVELTTQDDSAEWTKAGIMLRNSIPGAGSSLGYCALAFVPEHGVALMSDTNSDGGLDTGTGPSGLLAPIWLRLVRTSTTAVTGYYSTDGSTWASVGSATCSGANSTEDVGLFATSYNAGVTGHATFANFTTSNSPYSTFSNAQSALVEDGSGNFTIDSAGLDVWQGSDQYAAIYKASSADASSTTSVELNSQANSGDWTKAGIMLRNSIAGAGSSHGYCALGFIPNHGVALMSDTNSDGGLDTTVGPSGPSAPIWLRIVRTGGSSIHGYYSTNGTTWTSVGTATCSGANSTEDVGLFATSYATNVTGQATFSNFSISG
jgi:hypothetical protein